MVSSKQTITKYVFKLFIYHHKSEWLNKNINHTHAHTRTDHVCTLGTARNKERERNLMWGSVIRWYTVWGSNLVFGRAEEPYSLSNKAIFARQEKMGGGHSPRSEWWQAQWTGTEWPKKECRESFHSSGLIKTYNNIACQLVNTYCFNVCWKSSLGILNIILAGVWEMEARYF